MKYRTSERTGSDNSSGFVRNFIYSITRGVCNEFHQFERSIRLIVSSLQMVVYTLFHNLCSCGVLVVPCGVYHYAYAGNNGVRSNHSRFGNSYSSNNGISAFFIYFKQPRIVIEHYEEPTLDDSSEFRLGWILRNKGRTTANDVSVRIRFVLHTGDAKQFVDKEFIVINHETFLPPSGHQPVRKIRLRYKQGEDKFGLLLEIENTKENMIIERNWQWYPLPLFSSSGLNYYIVSIAVDGANLRDKDKELKKYSLSFAKEKPLIIPMESDVSDLFARLDI